MEYIASGFFEQFRKTLEARPSFDFKAADLRTLQAMILLKVLAIER